MSGGVLHACIAVADGKARRVLVEASVHRPGGSFRPETLSSAMERGVMQLSTQPGFTSKPLGLTVRRLSLLSGAPTQMTLHALVQLPHLFCCLASPDFPEELAKRLCDELALQGLEHVSRAAIDVSSEGSAGTSFTHAAGPGPSDALASLLERHADPERVARLHRLSEIQQSAGETVDLVSENVSRLLSNADDIEALEEKSIALVHQSRMLHRGVREVRRTECCNLYKLRVLFGFGCALTTAGVTMLVLVLTHAITVTINPIN